MKILKIIIFSLIIFNCKDIQSKKVILEKEKNKEDISLLLNSQKSLFDVIEQIRIYCEKEIGGFKSEFEFPEDFSKDLNKIIQHIDYTKKKAKNPQEIIKEINRYIFEELKIVPVPERESFRFLFPQLVYKFKKGNCLGLSLLYLLIGERVDLPFYAVIVPGHLFVRYDDGENIINIEPLKKGESKLDNWYIEKYSKKGMEAYLLKKATRKELIGIVFYNISTILMLEHKYKVALEFLKIAEECLPDNPEVKGNIALALDGIGECDSGLKILLELKKRYPDLENLEKNIGILQLKTKKYKDAVETYTLLCEKEPFLAENYYGLALSYYYLGDSNKALFFVEKAVKLKPDYREAFILLKKVSN